jgi:hypothetical protein
MGQPGSKAILLLPNRASSDAYGRSRPDNRPEALNPSVV